MPAPDAQASVGASPLTQACHGGTDAAVLLAPMLGFALTPSMLAAMWQSRRPVRLRSSKRSKLAWP